MRNTNSSKENCLKNYSDDIFVGIDSHLKSYHISLWGKDKGESLLDWVQPSDDPALMKKLEPYRSQIKEIVYEAGSVGFTLARNLRAQGWPVIVTSPSDVPTSRNEPKSDRSDAKRLAKLASRGLLQPIYIPTPEHEHERAIQRQRQLFLKDKKRHQLRIKMLLMGWGVKLSNDFRWREQETRELPCLVTAVDQQLIAEGYVVAYFQALAMVERCDALLEQLKEREHHKKNVALLTRLAGIGSRTALEYILEMGPQGRFKHKTQVAKYQGLAPDVHSSGQSRKEGPLNRSGNRRLKTLLIEAAWRWSSLDDHAKCYYKRMYANTGCAQKAITAVAHKLGIIMWTILETQTEYIPGGIHAKNPVEESTKALVPKRAAKTGNIQPSL